MKNIKLLFILLSLIAFSSYALAQTSNETTSKKFLRAKKHIKSVAKETQKLEKTLSEPELKETAEPVQGPVEEATTLTAPEKEATVVDETPLVKEVTPAENSKEEMTVEQSAGWLLSIEANTNFGMIRARDSYRRQLNLISSLGFGEHTVVGYRFDKHIALVADYNINRVGFENFDTYTVTQASTYLMKGKLGPRFYLTDRFNVELLAGLGQDYAIYPTSLTNINVEKFNHGSITLGLNYAMMRSSNFWFLGRTELEIYLSTTKPVFNTRTGLGANTSFKLGIPVSEKSAFYLNMGVGYTNLKVSVASQYGILGFGGLGFVIEN